MTRETLAPYASPEALTRRIDRLASGAGVHIHTLGASVEGRPLRALVYPHRDVEAPRLLCVANIHGIEYVGVELALALAETLAQPQSPQAVALRERAEVWVIPSLNPDGYARTWASAGTEPLSRLRTNARGVDLNRNFPSPGTRGSEGFPLTASVRPGAATYRGEAPLSEPEAAALDRLLAQQTFHASVGLHSFMGVLIPPCVREREAFARYRGLCNVFRGAQPTVRYRRLAHRTLDRFVGELEDHLFHAHRCWSLTIESFSLAASLRQHLRAPNTFWRFNPRDPVPWIRNDLPGVLAYFSAALGLAPVGPA